jgi:hypothetical protein
LRKTYALLALLLGVLLLGASPAGAITGNYQKDFIHSYVGLIAFYDKKDEFTHRCSGSLITARVFLTAGHCTDATTGATHARIWFQQDAGVGFDPVTGTPAPSGYPVSSDVTSSKLYNYGFADFAGLPNTRDVGVVILDKAITKTKQAGLVTTFGAIAAPRSLDVLATQRGQQAVDFTASGYGLSYSSPVGVVSFRERLMAVEQLINLGSNLTDGYNVQLTASRGEDRGGTCGGDSGGPLLYGTPGVSNTIVAVNSFGLNEWCRGNDFMYRVDRAEVQDWIKSVIGATEWSKVRVAGL